MNSIFRFSILLPVILVAGFAAAPASAYVTCSGCRIFGGYTVSGSSADSVSGYNAYVAGSSAYSIPGSSSYTTYGQGYDYCSQVYDPNRCGWYYMPRSYQVDTSGADYYVLGGPVYK